MALLFAAAARSVIGVSDETFLAENNNVRSKSVSYRQSLEHFLLFFPGGFIRSGDLLRDEDRIG